MNKITIGAAYHEAGHVVALLLTDRRFEYVTIVPTKGKVDKSIKLGHVKTKPYKFKKGDVTLSFFMPNEFQSFFRYNFLNIAGHVTEKIRTGRYDNLWDSSDFRKLVYITLENCPDNLRRSYEKFLFDYTKEVLTKEANWKRITAIAEALLEKKTLNYNEVNEVLRSIIW